MENNVPVERKWKCVAVFGLIVRRLFIYIENPACNV